MGGMTPYPGGKAQLGVYHKLIRLMPPHETYVEPFVGHGGVLRAKRPAAVTIGIDADPRCVDWMQSARALCPGMRLVCGDALEVMPRLPELQQPTTMVYADPPYLGVTRKHRAYYEHEFMSPAQHLRLLVLLRSLPCMVMLSGYAHPLYDEQLADWRSVTFTAMSRGGRRVEKVWLNFPEPAVIHDARFAGTTYRERVRIRRKIERWRRRVEAMPPLERQALLEALLATDPSVRNDVNACS